MNYFSVILQLYETADSARGQSRNLIEPGHQEKSTNIRKTDDIDDFIASIAADNGNNTQISYQSQKKQISNTEGVKQLHQPATFSTNIDKKPIHTATIQQKGENSSKVRDYCQPTLIAGINAPRGLNLLSSVQKACDKLRCTQCDFNIVQLDGMSWKNDSQYVDFRNANTQRAALLELATTRKNSVAYCCQCSWISIEQQGLFSTNSTTLPTVGGRGGDLHWVCGGHKRL
ncbi:MAG: hypothetical protein EZS28_036915 [Streblomastix strix]|uniref:Cilia- and flagella-associated protein 418 n=1 Tax=Streblomastix strix TaxID=222440 RepID=A0A5J4UAT9_9EUKA|nr:MAG: hypothetical protein EZS28_036915 [Streblomastix strix]